MVVALGGEFVLVIGSFLEELVFLALNPLDEISATLLGGFGDRGRTLRRKTLELFTEQQTLNRDEIARELVADETVSFESADRLAISLHHLHLPKLDEMGYIEYDPRSGDAVRWKDPDALKRRLE